MARRSRSRSPRDRRRSRDRSRSRDRHRSRHRSRSRDRRSHRSRDRSRSRDRGRRDERHRFEPSQAHADMVQRMQHEAIQKQLLAQQMLLQQQAAGGAGGAQPSRKQREVYVGNLAIGAVSDMVLRELFNQSLSHLVPDPIGNPPVVNAAVDPTGRFGFVELRSDELASSAMQLDKVDVCGRSINVGRPKGYVEPPGGPVPALTFNAAAAFAASLAQRASAVLLFENMLKAHQLQDDRERDELVLDLKDECEKYGSVQGIAVPKPPPHVRQQPGRAYVRFATAEEAEKALPAFNGREFDGNTVTAKVAPEEEFDRAFGGQWTGGLDPVPVPVMPHVYMQPNPQAGALPV